jgi:hypothetical protein
MTVTQCYVATIVSGWVFVVLLVVALCQAAKGD